MIVALFLFILFSLQNNSNSIVILCIFEKNRLTTVVTAILKRKMKGSAPLLKVMLFRSVY